MNKYERQLDATGLTIIEKRMMYEVPKLLTMLEPVLKQEKPPGKFEFIKLGPDVGTMIMDDLDIQSMIRRFCGSHARLDNHFCFSYPGEGVSPNIHGGPFSELRSVYYQRHGDTVQTSNLKVGIALQDQAGLAYVPGSHVMLPQRNKEKGLTSPSLSAGDVVVFTDALIHGTTHTTYPRQMLYYTFTPGHVAWSSWYEPEWLNQVPVTRRKFFRAPGVMVIDPTDRAKLRPRDATFQ